MFIQKLHVTLLNKYTGSCKTHYVQNAHSDKVLFRAKNI